MGTLGRVWIGERLQRGFSKGSQFPRGLWDGAGRIFLGHSLTQTPLIFKPRRQGDIPWSTFPTWIYGPKPLRFQGLLCRTGCSHIP